MRRALPLISFASQSRAGGRNRFSGLGRLQPESHDHLALAQRYFDQGLAFLYGFNYTEAARSFEAAAACDPQCAMAYWGIAIANGDAISDPAADEPLAKAAVEALAKARDSGGRRAPRRTGPDRSLSLRYADPPPSDPRPLDRAYAAAMRQSLENLSRRWRRRRPDRAGPDAAVTAKALGRTRESRSRARTR